jgi:hypothetical protein
VWSVAEKKKERNRSEDVVREQEMVKRNMENKRKKKEKEKNRSLT